jgi:hypothetical protein
MSFSRLQQILLDKIQYYLDHDNPEPQSDGSVIDGIFNSIYALFKEEGRGRAKNYKTIISAYQNDRELLIDTFNDFRNPDSRLESSTDLRKRIFEGLCEFFNISLEIQPPMHIVYGYTGAGLFAGVNYQTQNEFLKQRQMNALRDRVDNALRNTTLDVDESYQPRQRQSMG